jgi:hypothetical protein
MLSAIRPSEGEDPLVPDGLVQDHPRRVVNGLGLAIEPHVEHCAPYGPLPVVLLLLRFLGIQVVGTEETVVHQTLGLLVGEFAPLVGMAGGGRYVV